jgi:cyclopropane fatty-acyl-phospholipid synthase-like methyltransferase
MTDTSEHPPQQDPSPTANSARASTYSDGVRAYWEETTNLYLPHGTTFQVGFVSAPGQPTNAHTNNLQLAARAGIQPGQRVLDAGCGVCGPSIDIARSIPDIHIDAVTLSPLQATHARNRVSEAALTRQIEVHVGDYHALPFESGRFDVVFFFESMYSEDLPKLFAEVLRLLTPGGIFYAKEIFCMEKKLSLLEQAGLREFEEIFRYKARLMSETLDALIAAGFDHVESEDLTPLVSTRHFDEAMVENVYGFPSPTALGRRHIRHFRSAPLLLGEIRARKPG